MFSTFTNVLGILYRSKDLNTLLKYVIEVDFIDDVFSLHYHDYYSILLFVAYDEMRQLTTYLVN